MKIVTNLYLFVYEEMISDAVSLSVSQQVGNSCHSPIPPYRLNKNT